MRLNSLKLPSWSKIALIGAILFAFRIMAAMAREHQELESALLAHPIFGGLVLLTFAMAVGEIVMRRRK
ncbi:hypothetical protein GCM10017673_52620 [Streptosporangium violaceochromogenes]|nr:hypothetical protein GCM10017673_52620 [Streptosporangium violaceochromogenes]